MGKILITGGAGFIGSYCVEKFKNEGYSVTVLDNFSTTGQNDNDKIFEDVNLIKGDILDYKWEDLEDYDLILHMASPVGPAGVLKHSGNMARYIMDDVYCNSAYCIDPHKAWRKEIDNNRIQEIDKFSNQGNSRGFAIGKLIK